MNPYSEPQPEREHGEQINQPERGEHPSDWRFYSIASLTPETLKDELTGDAELDHEKLLMLNFVEASRIVPNGNIDSHLTNGDDRHDVADAVLNQVGLRPGPIELIDGTSDQPTIAIARFSPYHIVDEDTPPLASLRISGLLGDLPDQVHERWELNEMQKKRDIIEIWCTQFGTELGISSEKATTVMAELDVAQTLSEVAAIYQYVVRTSRGLRATHALEALRFANIFEELREIDGYENRIEANLRMLDILPSFTDEEPLAKLQSLSPKLAELLKRFDRESHELTLVTNPDGLQRRTPIESLSYLNDQHQEEVNTLLAERFDIQPHEYPELAEICNAFIRNLGDNVLEQRGTTLTRYDLSMFEEVRSADPVTLLQIAAGVGKISDAYKAENLEAYKRLRYEARYKLYLMSEMAPIARRHDAEKRRDVRPLQALWRGVFSPGQQRGTEIIRRIELRTSDDENPGPSIEVVNIDRALKTLYSRTEKAFRDGDPDDLSKETDLRARALRIEHCPPVLLEYVPLEPAHDLTFFTIHRDGALGLPDEVQQQAPIKDYAVVFELMKTIRYRTKTALGPKWQTYFAKYSPTPEGETYGYQGRSGAGAKIRMAKFVVVLVNEEAKARITEEVQVFLPGLGKAAKDFHEEYQRDHARRYYRERVLRPSARSRRPFAEQVFSPRRYPIMRRRREIGIARKTT